MEVMDTSAVRGWGVGGGGGRRGSVKRRGGERERGRGEDGEEGERGEEGRGEEGEGEGLRECRHYTTLDYSVECPLCTLSQIFSTVSCPRNPHALSTSLRILNPLPHSTHPHPHVCTPHINLDPAPFLQVKGGALGEKKGPGIHCLRMC